MGARKLKGLAVQLMSLEAIKLDRSLQSRVATSIEYQREFSEAMLRGDEFPPVVVFFDGKSNWLADGFHRVGAAKKAGRREIRAEVREGTKRDASLFSAGANQKFSIPRTKEDVRKAVEMVLSDAEGFTWSLNRLSKHVGVSESAIRRHRAEFCAAQGIEVPTEVIGANGEAYRAADGVPAGWNMRFRDRGSKGRCYEAKRAGRNPVYLSADEGTAEAKLRELRASDPARGQPRPDRVPCNDHLPDWLASNGFGFRGWKNVALAAIAGYHGFGHAFVYVEEMTPTNFVTAVGRVLLFRQQIDASLKPVILAHRDTLQREPIELARQIGVEVMTPEEFLEALRAEKAP